MFGTNPVHKQELGNGQSLRVQEVFLTIQGEGPLAGTPAVFIRMAGCNLRCKFCDTEFDSGYEVPISLKSLLAKVMEAQGSCEVLLVVITGGEPLLQNIEPLCSNLASLGYQVQIETAGTVWVPGLEDMDELTIVVSPKTRKIHSMIEKWATDWKYIIIAGETDPVDGLPMGTTQRLKLEGLKKPRGVSLIAKPPPHITSNHIFLQPCDAGKGFEVQSERNRQFAAQLAIRHGYRLSLQQHKILNLP